MMRPAPKPRMTEEQLQHRAAQRQAVLERLGTALAEKRKEAIEARQSSGIEEIWTQDEEFYEGYDDANRHEFGAATRKPTEGGRTAEPSKPTGCTLFPNITAPYVDAAAAKVGDMLLPTDERNFVLEETSMPDVLDEGEGFTPIKIERQQTMPPEQAGAVGAIAQALAGAQQAGQPAAQPQQVQVDAMAKVIAKLQAIKDTARKAAKQAQTLIDDWLQECQYHAELRDAIDDAARIGTGVMKGPFPVKRRSRIWTRDPETGDYVYVVKEETVPASKRVDPWNFFPGKGCGQNIQRASSCWERDFLTARQLADLKGGEGAAAYIDAQIDVVLREGPQKRKAEALGMLQMQQELDTKEVFEVWYGYATLTGEEMEAAGCECDDPLAQYPALVTMVNDRVIKAADNPHPDGEFPYDVLPWKRRKGMPWGMGVGRQGRTAQRITTAALRNMMDNAGASAKPHKVTTDAIQPGADPWTWEVDSEAGPADVRAAMSFFVAPSLQGEMLNIISMGERMMELHTGLPMIILGMQGNIQETAAGRALQNNNGSTVLRRIARLFDSCITEPHVRRYYAWVMEHVDDPTVKGDFQIHARGSSALVERDIQNQQLPVLLGQSLNPAFDLDPKLAMQEYLKSQRFDPKAFAMTAERRKEIADMQPKPQPPYQIVVAEAREKGETQRLQMKLGHEAQQNDLDRQLDLRVKDVDAQLAREDLSAEERAQLQDHKVDLAKVVMQLRAIPAKQAVRPEVEPPQRAPAGQAFVQ